MALVATELELYARGVATLLASWDEVARGAEGAALRRLDGVTAAVFPSGPERAVYNNALFARDLGPDRRIAAVDRMEAAYRSAEVDRYAAWVHESDEGMRAELTGRGYTLVESTRAMGMSLDEFPAPRHAIDVEIEPLRDWGDYLAYLTGMGAPAGLLAGADPSAFHTLAARLGGETVGTAIAFDHDGDCGVFNTSTVAEARRRGIGTALTSRHLHDAAARGCSTASLQSTPIAEGVYAAVGFRDLGRFLEFGP